MASGSDDVSGTVERVKSLIQIFSKIFDESSFTTFIKHTGARQSKTAQIQSRLSDLLTLLNESSPRAREQAKILGNQLSEVRQSIQPKARLPHLRTLIDKLEPVIDAAKQQKSTRPKAYAPIESSFTSLRRACDEKSPTAESAQSILQLFEAFVEANERFWRENGSVKRAWKGQLSKHKDAAEVGIHELITCFSMGPRLDLLIERLSQIAKGSLEINKSGGIAKNIFTKHAPQQGAAITINPVRQGRGRPYEEMVNERVRRYSAAISMASEMPNPWGELAKLEREHEALASVAGLEVSDLVEMKRVNDGLQKEIKELRAKNTKVEKKLMR